MDRFWPTKNYTDPSTHSRRGNSQLYVRLHKQTFWSYQVTTKVQSVEQEGQKRKETALTRLRELLRKNQRVQYEEIVGSLLELPLVWQSDVNKMIMDLRGKELEVEGLRARERTPKRGYMIVRKRAT